MLALELARFIPLCLLIGYAAVLDQRTTNVPNTVWRYAVIGFTLTMIDAATNLNLNMFLYELAIIGFSIVLSYGIFALGGWGGADSKAFMTIAASAPLFPSWSIFNNLSFPFSVLPFGVLFVASTLVLAYTLYIKSDEPLKQRRIKFMPFMFISLIICVLL